ncbi:MAG: pilus assembly PilX N-terminal domain-containing protein [Deltaproteobacteria bacterium]|nr:pilus assembly PilX N-terminal domain-containing protein [Deltaproteobacteria bacterium]
MKNKRNIISDDEGMALVLILMIIALITLAGISSIDTSTTEMQTATNDVQHKLAFYIAEGGLDVASELLEQNLCCPSGFTEDEEDLGEATIARVTELDFWKNTTMSDPSDANRDIFFPNNYGAGPHTNITIAGSTVLGVGSALQMAAGYEGKGKGAAGGAGHIVYDIHTQHFGRGNSISELMIEWRHVIGQEEDCKY